MRSMVGRERQIRTSSTKRFHTVKGSVSIICVSFPVYSYCAIIHFKNAVLMQWFRTFRTAVLNSIVTYSIITTNYYLVSCLESLTQYNKTIIIISLAVLKV